MRTRTILPLPLWALLILNSLVTTTNAQVSFVLGQQDGITIVNPNAPSSRIFIKHPAPVLSVDVDVSNWKVYWADADGKITRANLDGTAIETIQTQYSMHPEAIAVDLITGNIFYADGHRRTVGVCNKDGSSCTDLGEPSLRVDLDFAVNPLNGELYLLNEPGPGSIAKTDMDSFRLEGVVDQYSGLLKHIAIDYHTGELFWEDNSHSTIFSTNPAEYNRFQKEFEDSKSRSDIVAVDVIDGNMCWVRSSGVAIECALRGRSGYETVYNHTTRVTDLKISHPLRSLLGRRPNNCQGNPCSHICVLTRSSHRCLCPPGLGIQADKRTCL